VNAGRVHENDLGRLGGENAQLPAAGGLRARRDNGNFLAEEGIEQSGLAHVGAAYYGDETGFERGRVQWRVITKYQLLIIELW
jgi:hypothetical protein